MSNKDCNIDFRISNKFIDYSGSELYNYDYWAEFISLVIDYLYKEYEINQALKVYFKPTRLTCFKYRRYTSGEYELIFGIRTLIYEFEKGACEYESCQYILPEYIVKGYQALLYIALHEFSHLLQRERATIKEYKPGKRRNVHTRNFQIIHLELIELFQANNILGLWNNFIPEGELRNYPYRLPNFYHHISP